jgi:hypothetical protein
MGLLCSRPVRRPRFGAGANGAQAALPRRAIYLSMSTICVDLSS